MDITEKILLVNSLRQEIEANGKLPDVVLKRINYKFRLDWNYYSNTMEGNTLTRSETRSVMIGNITVDGKPIKDVLEIKGHDEAINNILKIGKGELTISERRIKDMHKAIMYADDQEQKQQIGEWKKKNNEIINYKNEKFEFSPPSRVNEEMHTLINWLNSEADKIKMSKKDSIHPAILAFEFHLRYLTIHPFFDGNGRTARIFMNLILISNGYPPVIIKKDDKISYYQYLADIQAYEAPKDFYYNFMLGLLVRSEELVLKAIKGEEIEEPDDLDKEIALLKAKLQNQEQVTEKMTKDYVFKVIRESIVPFIHQIEKNVSQFNDMFNSANIVLAFREYSQQHNLDFKSKSSIEEQELFINEMYSKNIVPREISCEFNWDGFKYNKIRPHGAYIRIHVSFDEYNYTLNKAHQVNQLPEVIKIYNEVLSQEEQDTIIQAIKKQVLEQVNRLVDEKNQ